MTTEAKKPTEWLTEAREHIAANELFTPRFELLSGIGQAHASLTAMGRYLDREHERRQAWERSVEERLARAEHQPQLVAKDGALFYEQHREQVMAAGNGVAPVGVYAGDGHPAARAKYEPEPEGSEEL